MEIKNDYKQLDGLRINHPVTNKAVMGFGVAAQFYFKNGWREDMRRACLDVVDRYMARYPDKITHFIKGGAKRASAMPESGATGAYGAELAGLDPEKGYFGAVFENKDFLSGAGVFFNTGAKINSARRPLSSLTARFSCKDVQSDPNGVVEFVLELCNTLKPDQATVGLSPLGEPGMGTAYPQVFWPFLSRFPGLDFQWAFALAVEANRGIRCINWLTILDDGYVADLGGRDALANAMGDAVTIYDWDGGILIRAGAEPQLGDRNQGIWPAEYVIVNNATKPVRFEDYGTRRGNLIPVPEPLDPHEETLNWIRRFDRENE